MIRERAKKFWPMLVAGVLLLHILTAAEVPGTPEKNGSPPLLGWDLLRSTHYVPRTQIDWPKGIQALDDHTVRVEGYLMPKFGAQDDSDLLVTGLHPSSLICGPTDMTAFVEVYMPGFSTENWPTLPVEVTGTLLLSKRPGNMRFIYRLYGHSWRELRRWEQDFPGTTKDDEYDSRDLGP